jgi:hypothetical protein
MGHVVRVRDLRRRFGDDELFRAECSCGWSGEVHTGATGQRIARRDGLRHVEMAPTLPWYPLTDRERSVIAALQEAASTPNLSDPVWDALVLLELVWLDSSKRPPVMRLTDAGRNYPAP